jgi:hypothetical protein
MGVFSRTMLMLTMAWLVGLFVTFLFLSNSSEPSWRDKFVAEANIRRALAYRTVDLTGGTVAERGHDKGSDASQQSLSAESIGAAPGATGSTDPLPGASIRNEVSLIELERRSGDDRGRNLQEVRTNLEEQIDGMLSRLAELQQQRRTADARLGRVRDQARAFASEVNSFRSILAHFHQTVWNLDYDIKRLIIEKDALVAELAQINNDIRRIDGQRRTLEDSYYELSRGYERTIKVLAWYEQADPDLRRLADTAGRGWLRGKVVSVGSDPRTGVVSISLGSHEGVFVGQTFTIYRNDQFVGRLVIDSVRANVSVGTLEREYRGRAHVSVGDSVKTAEPFGGATLRR